MELDDAYQLARELLDSHGLEAWTVTFDSARRRAGQTVFPTSTISLSSPLTQLCTPEQVRGTVLHEIAHALVGPGHNHDGTWKEVAQSIGASPRAQFKGGPQVPARYIGICPAGHTVHRHRRSRNLQSCAKCCPEFNLDYLITWHDTQVPAWL